VTAARAPSKPGWWFVAGLALGLLVALWVYLQGPRAAKPAPTASNVMEKNSAGDKTGVASTKPRFDFYTILPELEVALPDPETRPKAGAAQEGKPEAYILQAGSFKNFAEADRLKASLNLIGIEAGIQTVTVNNKDTWHRVQIGPYRDVAELNAVRARLKQNNIDAVLLKLKG
jgi:cell division protein FtsN